MLINPLSLTRREKLQKNQMHKKAGLTVGILHTYIKTFLILCTCSFCLSYKKSSQTLTFVQFSTKTHCIAKLFRKEWIYDKLERMKWAHKLYLLNSPEHYPFIFEKKNVLCLLNFHCKKIKNIHTLSSAKKTWICLYRRNSEHAVNRSAKTRMKQKLI